TRVPRAEVFAFENTGRVILDSFADHDFAADLHEIEHAADSVARCRIRCFLVAASEPPQRVQRCCFSCTHKIQLDDALDVLIILLRQSQSHGSLIFTQVEREYKTSRSDGFLWARRSLGEETAVRVTSTA